MIALWGQWAEAYWEVIARLDGFQVKVEIVKVGWLENQVGGPTYLLFPSQVFENPVQVTFLDLVIYVLTNYL